MLKAGRNGPDVREIAGVLGIGVVWDSGHGILPTKTSHRPHDLHFCWLKGLSPALLVGKLRCVPGARASDGWCGCLWLSWLCIVIVYVLCGLAHCVLPVSCAVIQASSFYFTSGCMESTQIVVILYSLKLCSSSKCHSGR